MSALLRKSITDLTRRKARTFFTVADARARGREHRVLRGPDADRPLDAGGGARRRLADLTVSMRPLPLDRRAARGARGAAERRGGRAAARAWRRGCYVGERRAPARADRRPGLRAPAGRRRARRLRGGARRRRGARRRAERERQGCTTSAPATRSPASSAPSGRRRGTLRDQRRGAQPAGGEEVQDDDVVVLYATAETVAALSGERGLQPARLPARRHEPGRGRDDGRGGAHSPRGVPGLHGLHRACRRCARPVTGRARRTPTQFAELLRA